VKLGFWLAGIVIAMTAVSYVLNLEFVYQWLVWVIGIAFAGVALLACEWPRALRSPLSDVPKGRIRQFLLASIPLSFILASQYCGLGLEACTVLCNVISFTMMELGAVTAYRIHRGQSIGAVLILTVIIGLIPHCVCHAPINAIWHSIPGSVAPTCQVIPLAATLFAVSALRGARPRLSAGIVGMLLLVTVFIVVGNPVLGFPWEGCVH